MIHFKGIKNFLALSLSLSPPLSLSLSLSLMEKNVYIHAYPFGAGIIFLILAQSVYKMWIMQEPNKLALWNKLHFEQKKTEIIEHV